MFRRESLPLFKVLPDCRINIEKLQKHILTKNLSDYSRYIDLDTGGEYEHLCNQNDHIHRKFVDKNELEHGKGCYNGKSFRQLALTSFDSESFPNVKMEKKIENRSKAVRMSSNPESKNYLPQLDERNYRVPNEFVDDVFEEVLNTFKAPYTRVRLAVLMPEFECEPHIDYNTNYSIRVHIPIFTNLKTFFCYDDPKRETTKQHMPADGRIWFVNTGYRHWVENYGSSPRLHLVVSLLDQRDLWTEKGAPTACQK